MKCVKCGSEGPEGAKFCFECGYKFPMEKSCPNCHTKELPATAKFCPNCGTSLVEAAPDVPKSTRPDILDNMVLVEPGTFEMTGRFPFESRPKEDAYTVILTKPFYIGKYPVTQAEWLKIMDDNPSDNQGFNLPVINVSWLDALFFCNMLNKVYGYEPCYEFQTIKKTFDDDDYVYNIKFAKWIKNKKGFRLPSEAEWEFSARGGIKSIGYKYPGSNTINDVAWTEANSEGRLHEVGLLKPNELGIFDMLGNTTEWCWDYGYEIREYIGLTKINPTNTRPIDEIDDPFDCGSIMRGGSFNNSYPQRCTCVWDNKFTPFGFRLVFSE